MAKKTVTSRVINRKSFQELLDALIVDGNQIGNLSFIIEVHQSLGSPHIGESITSYTTKEILMQAYDEGKL